MRGEKRRGKCRRGIIAGGGGEGEGVGRRIEGREVAAILRSLQGWGEEEYQRVLNLL